jgi:hypothetical protein
MKAIYNKNTGQILVYANDDLDIDALKSNWPDLASVVDISNQPPKKEFGQWHINLQTKTLERIA